MTRSLRAHCLLFLVGLMVCPLVTALVNVTPALAQGACTPTFTQPAGSPFGVGAAPNAIASVDMSGDGQADLAVVNGSDGTVSIFLGNGLGGFTPAPGSPITVGGSPSSVAVGNFNGDAFPDLAVGVPGPNLVAILLGTGNGSFSQEAGAIPVGDAPGGIAVGNFNNDGLVDLAVTGIFASNLRILLGSGAGGFFQAAGSPIAISGEPKSIVAGSFNGDGLADLAITHGGSTNVVTVLVGTGNATFSQAPGSPMSVGTTPSALTVGDFNADSRFDLAVANAGSNNVAILLGIGNGGFTPATGSPIAGISSPNGIVAGRFNDDTVEDLAVASTGSNSVVILHGNGSGGFTPASTGSVAVGQQPVALTAASLNGDPITDLAVVNQASSNVSVLVNSCLVADLGLTVTDGPDPVPLGADLGYTIAVQNAGPDPATAVTLSAPTPPGTTFFQMVSPAGWMCTTPAVGQTGTVTCTFASLPVGTATHTLIVKLGSDVPVGVALQNTVTVSASTQDPSSANNTATVSTTVTPAPGTCAPRPRVVLTLTREGTDRIAVAFESSNNASTPNNRLNQVNLTIPANARVDVVGGQNDLTGQQSLTVSNGTQPLILFVRRVGGTAVTIPIEVLDQCGTWRTFAGGGPGAF